MSEERVFEIVAFIAGVLLSASFQVQSNAQNAAIQQQLQRLEQRAEQQELILRRAQQW